MYRQSIKCHIINSPYSTWMLLTLNVHLEKREHGKGGVAFHLNWCLSFAITSNVIADI